VQAGADAVLDNMDAGLWPLWIPRRDELLNEAREHLGATDDARARSAGCDCTFEQVVTQAIAAITRSLTDVSSDEN
jgi:hypothetical protein